MQQYKSKLISVFEDLIIVLVMLIVLLPVRLVFYNFVSDNWLGSFGLISLVVILLVYLSKKNKLGYFGRIYWKSITRVHKGKRRIISYCTLALLLYFHTSIIIGAYVADTSQEAIELKAQLKNNITPQMQIQIDAMNTAVSEYDIAETQKLMMDTYNDVPALGVVAAAITFLIIPIAAPVLWAVLVSFIDDIFSGWLLHFSTVMFIETLEIIGVMIYTYTQRNKEIEARE